MKVHAKRFFAILLTVLLIADSQSAACSTLVSFATGTKQVLASEVSTENSTDFVVDAETVEDTAESVEPAEAEQEEESSLPAEEADSEDEEEAVQEEESNTPEEDTEEADSEDAGDAEQEEDNSAGEMDSADEDSDEEQKAESFESGNGEETEADSDNDVQNDAEASQAAETIDQAAVLADSVLVTAVLEDSQTPISEEYTNVSIPVENDVLDLEKSPIEEEITCAAQVAGTNRLYVETFTYGFATVGESEISSLNRADITEGTCIFLHYFSNKKKTKYVYEDQDIKVTATVNDPEAVPDDAQFVVRPITKADNADAHETYMSALNDYSGKETSSFTDENTLLYDIAFLSQKADENGNPIEGEYVEIQPDGENVTISVAFKKKQMANDIGAKKNEDLAVYHLPLEESVKSDADSTMDVTSFEVSDVIVEPVNDNIQNVNVEKETVSFSVDVFSVFAFTVDFHFEGTDYSIPGSTQILLSELIQQLHITEDGTKDGKLVDVIDVKEVRFSNEELVTVDKVAGVITYLAADGLRENVDVGEQDFLITSKKAFSSDETMTIILKDGREIVVRVTDAPNALDVPISVYDYDDATLITIPNDLSSDRIYLVVWVGDSNDISAVTSNTPWTVIDVTGMKGQNSPYNIQIERFNIQEWSTDQSLNYSNLTPEQKANIKARLVHTTRNLDQMTLGQLKNRFWNESEFTLMWNGGFDGYGISGNHPSELVEEGRYEVNLKKTYTKEQDVVFEFENPSDAGPVDSGYYAVLRGLKYGGNPANDWEYYYYVVPVSVDGSNPKVYIPVTGYWSDNQQFSENWTNLSATIIRAKGNANIQEGGHKPDINAYTDAYVMGNYTFTYEGYVSETDDENQVERQEFRFVLKKAEYEPAKTPKEITGPGIDFGITANEFHQAGHLQSNFATNNYSGHGTSDINVQVDLTNKAGTSVASKITGNVFWNESRNATFLTNSNDVGKIGGNTTDALVIEEAPEAKIKNMIVDPIIDHGATMSDLLINKEPTFTPNSNSIDTTQFPDGITIYLDGDKLKDALAHNGNGDIKLNMLPNQVIVFNFDETENLRIGQILCNISGGESSFEFMAEHLVFNCASVKNLELDTSIGMHLVPKVDSKTYITGSSEGWIITSGYFENVSQPNEWHFRYQHLKEPKNIYVNFEKTLDDQKPEANEVFEFELSVWNDVDKTWDFVKTLENKESNIKYEIEPGDGRVFRIKEIGKKSTTEGNYKTDKKEYFVLARYYLDITAHATYYSTFEEAERVWRDDLQEDDGDTISKIVFKNETKEDTDTGTLRFTKSVTGGVTQEEAEGALTFTIQNETTGKYLQISEEGEAS